MRLQLTVLAAMAVGVGACAGPTSDVTAPVRPAFDVNTNTNVRLTITYSGPTIAPYGSRPTFSATATLNGSPVQNVQIAFDFYSLSDGQYLALCTASTDASGVATCQFYPLLFDPTSDPALDVVVSAGGDFSGNMYSGGLLRQPFALGAAPTVTTYTGAATFMSTNDTTVTLSATTTWSGCNAQLTCGALRVAAGEYVNLEIDDTYGDALAYCQTKTDADGNATCTSSAQLPAGPIILSAYYNPYFISHDFQPSRGTVAGVVIQSPPPLPTTKQDCMNGGWMKYGVFKNQGDCVSWVATHGKNSPSRSQ